MSSDNSTSAFSKLSYLIVDDFENFRLSMRQMLRTFGADKIELVSNGNAAIQRCAYDHYDVVLCDYNLGEGKSGQHILEELRHKKLLKHSSLFLMVTAETSKEMVMGAREHQPDAYLTKPINRAMLEKRLGSLITQRQALLPINREIDRENYPEAISLCLQIIPRQPRYKTWLMKTLADLYFRVGDYSHARKIYDDVLAQRDLSWARLGKGKILLAEQHYDDAVGVLKDLLAKHPDYMEAYDQLAEALSRQGKLPQAQQILEKAAEQSPNALMRQKQLATVATANQDIGTASDAWRKTISLGNYSIHDSSEHYLALGQSLSDLSEGDQSDEAKVQADEALKVLARMEKRFDEEPNISVKSRVVQSRVHAGQGRTKEAEKILDSVSKELADEDDLDADLGIDYAKTLFRLGREEQAKKLLGKLAERFDGNTDILQKIENLLDEPVGFKEKLQARSLNRDGIKSFESGALEDAVAAFGRALAIVPSHAALNLNLVQVRIKQYLDGTRDPALLQECEKRLNALNKLPEQHRQYRRYVSLRKKLESLKS